MNKKWIVGQVAGSGEINNIKYLIESAQYFDGICFCVNYQDDKFKDDDGTYELLEQNKGKGRIVRANWARIHSIGMNLALHSGPVKHYDWICILDSQESLKQEFLTVLDDRIKEWEKDRVWTVSWGRPYFVYYHEWQIFSPTSCHCTINPTYPKYLSIVDEAKVKYFDDCVHFGDFLINRKKFGNTMLLSGVKYYLYEVSNQLNMFYGDKGQKVLDEHEYNRLTFCIIELENKGYSRTLDGLESFFKNKKNLTEEVIKLLNYEWVLRDFYRYKILGHLLEEIMKNRYNYVLSEKDFK